MNMRSLAPILLCLLLAGCASAPGIPETSYFRLPPRASLAPVEVALGDPVLADPVLADPVMVQPFMADGVHANQALLYSLDPGGERLRTYHYQLWVDPPTRMLQRRLIAQLRDAGVATLVAGQLPPSRSLWRVQGRIEAFERVRRGDGWHVQVALQLRLDHGDEPMPRLLRDYRRELPAGGETVRDSVRAFGAAIDAIYAEFLADMIASAGTAAG
jgi:cholesterol transport system auxiliary component